MSLEVDGVWKAGVWASTVWADDVWREGEPPPAPPVVNTEVKGGGKRRRSYVEIEGKLVEVSGYEEAERLLAELKQEEKAQEKARKQLRISLGRVRDSGPSVGIYAEQKKIEAIERQMDVRADRIAKLYILIQNNLETEITEDDEEVLLLS